MLRVKLSKEEERRYRALAESHNLTFSSYVRMILEEKHIEYKRGTRL